jgi:hypothetical protein
LAACEGGVAPFTGKEHNNAHFDTQLEPVVKALLTGDGGREEPPVGLLWGAYKAGSLFTASSLAVRSMWV